MGQLCTNRCPPAINAKASSNSYRVGAQGLVTHAMHIHVEGSVTRDVHMMDPLEMDLHVAVNYHVGAEN